MVTLHNNEKKIDNVVSKEDRYVNGTGVNIIREINVDRSIVYQVYTQWII